MAELVGERLPESLVSVLDGRELERLDGFTVLLLTVDGDGWARQAMLSLGELVALSPDELALALWPDSASAANLSRGGQATLTLVHEQVGYTIRCAARRTADLELARSGRLARFRLRTLAVLADRAPYAELTGGVSYRLLDRESVLARWRETVAALRETPRDS